MMGVVDTSFASGLVAGSMTACLFSPVDRALFLSHVHKRPFLRWANFRNPFHGVNQVMLQRVISGGMCFPLEDLVRRNCPTGAPGTFQHNFVSGTLSGSMIAVVTNPLASITFQKWAAQHKGGIFEVAHHMWTNGGITCFNRAIYTTLARDFLWGGTFSCLRHELPKYLSEGEDVDAVTGTQRPGMVSFLSNVIAAGVATAISSPLNYARNLQYAHDLSKGHLATSRIFADVWADARANQLRTGEGRFQFLANRFTLGWGSLRVSVGIAVSSQIYNFCVVKFNKSDR